MMDCRNFRSNDISLFRDDVKDYLDAEPSGGSIDAAVPSTSNRSRKSNEVEIEKRSSLRIKNQLISAVELSNCFFVIRFVRLQVTRNLIMGDTFTGCWTALGVLIEKDSAKMSSSGKSYSVWKMGGVNGTNVSVFFFGDAYTMNNNEPVEAVFAFFNALVRNDLSNGFFSKCTLCDQYFKDRDFC